MPEFFFTLSFLIEFFENYYNDSFDGVDNTNQRSFIDFFEISHGHLLIDRSMKDIENYPKLNNLVGRPDNQNYRPYQKISAMISPKGLNIPIEKEDEYNGILSHVASFTNSLLPLEKSQLEKQCFKPIFDSKEVKSSFAELSKIKSIKKGVKYNWDEILAPFKKPSSSIIICDNYILTKTESIIENNLIPILNFFSNLRMDKIPVTILSAKKSNENYKKIKEKYEQRFNRDYSQTLKIEIVFIEGGIKEEHDRRIVSDSISISVPHGLDILKNRMQESRGTTEPSIISFFDGRKENTEHLIFLQKELKKSIEVGRLQHRHL